MSGFPRSEIDEMVERWLRANRDCEASGDWRPLAEMYTEDATYGWNLGPNTDFMAVGREQIREFALGTEMGSLEGWTYPYEQLVIDEASGMVVGFWRQIADARRDDGSPFEVLGLGGSWFRYGGDFQWAWQRDWFDLGNVSALFLEMVAADKLSDSMKARVQMSDRGSMPGCYPAGTAPVQLWDR